MNKIILVALGVLAIFVFAACGGSDGDRVPNRPNPTPYSTGSHLSLSSDSVEMPVGSSVTLELALENPPPAHLGAYTIYVTSNNVVKFVSCSSHPVGLCNTTPLPPRTPRTTIFTGASARGLDSEQIVLGELEVLCETTGTTMLSIEIKILADATVGDPRAFAATLGSTQVVCT